MNDIQATDASPVTGEMLMGLFRRLGRGMDRARHHHGHSHHAQIHTLVAIQEKSPMGQRDLLELLDVRSSSLSEILAKLERGELITRERDERDKRNVILSITEKGAAKVAKLREHRQQTAEGIFEMLSHDEKDQLHILLGKVATALEAEFHTEGEHHGHCRHGEHHAEHHGGCRGGRHGGRHSHGHHGHGHGDERL